MDSFMRKMEMYHFESGIILVSNIFPAAGYLIYKKLDEWVTWEKIEQITGIKYDPKTDKFSKSPKK